MNFFKKSVKWLLFVSGTIFLLIIVLAFTTLPFRMYYALGVSEAKITSTPAVIVMMGGSGFPSESNLIRSFYTLKAAQTFQTAGILIALPGNTQDSTSSVRRLKKYFISQGIASSRILLETKGTNTRSQCLNISRMLPANTPLLIISSPEHLLRSVRSFRKAGFNDISGYPAFESANEANLLFQENTLGGRRLPLELGGDHLQVRYQFWNHLRYQVLVYREYCAIAYYKLKGWM
ncbi:MAG: YdcF family protein [Bacteroidia bacterium]|nr:YdcF family protein [Bacteroidia bacterium]